MVSKIIETVIVDQLNAYFIESNSVQFSSQQYGFRKKSSPELAAIELQDRLLDQLNQQKILINFHFDLSKAFDGLNLTHIPTHAIVHLSLDPGCWRLLLATTVNPM